MTPDGTAPRDPLRYRGGRALFYGLGKSGAALLDLLAPHLSDFALADDAPFEKTGLPAAYAAKFMPSAALAAAFPADRFDRFFPSPGVKPTAHLYAAAVAAGLAPEGEIECAWHLSRGDCIAVTGTDGKTTTTTLLAEILRRAFGPSRVRLAGNIGVPFARIAGSTAPGDRIALEISSFQAHAVRRFHPRVVALTNLAPDHLYWHGSFEEYARAKFNLLANATADDTLVLNVDDPHCVRLAAGRPCRTERISARGDASAPWRFDGARLLGPAGMICAREELRIPGIHNVENALVACAAAHAAGAGPDAMREALLAFRGVEHRLERVDGPGGVAFVNDSKATNVHAALTGIRAMTGPFRLMLGGSEKGEPFEPLAEALAASPVRSVHLSGHTAPRLAAALAPLSVPVETHADFDACFAAAAARARSGETVLLCPACASFDFFANFEARGRHFKDLVDRLAGR